MFKKMIFFLLLLFFLLHLIGPWVNLCVCVSLLETPLPRGLETSGQS